jgi:hypothetical protein
MVLSRKQNRSATEGFGEVICDSCGLKRVSSDGDGYSMGSDVNITSLAQWFALQHLPDPSKNGATFNTFLNALLLNIIDGRKLRNWSSVCPNCKQLSKASLRVTLTITLPIIFTLSDWELLDEPLPWIPFATVEGLAAIYDLCGIIYHGGCHWTARWIDVANGAAWDYDGVVNGGLLAPGGWMSAPYNGLPCCDLRRFNGWVPSKFIYALRLM